MTYFKCYCGTQTEFKIGLDVACCKCGSIYTYSFNKYSCERVDNTLFNPTIHDCAVGGISTVTFTEDEFISEQRDPGVE